MVKEMMKGEMILVERVTTEMGVLAMDLWKETGMGMQHCRKVTILVKQVHLHQALVTRTPVKMVVLVMNLIVEGIINVYVL